MDRSVFFRLLPCSHLLDRKPQGLAEDD